MTIASWAMWDYLTVNNGSNPLKLDYLWHVLQSTMTMVTALIGAVVGNLLSKRGERLDHLSVRHRAALSPLCRIAPADGSVMFPGDSGGLSLRWHWKD